MHPEGMVDALKEAHRVLSTGGIMIDVRPLSTNGPLEIVFEGGRDLAGLVDMSPGMDQDQAADRAIEAVLTGKLYQEVRVEYFDFAYYWQTVAGMQEDIEENWLGEVVITEEVWRKAHQLYNHRRPGTQVRMGCRMKLGVYSKIGQRDPVRQK